MQSLPPRTVIISLLGLIQFVSPYLKLALGRWPCYSALLQFLSSSNLNATVRHPWAFRLLTLLFTEQCSLQRNPFYSRRSQFDVEQCSQTHGQGSLKEGARVKLQRRALCGTGILIVYKFLAMKQGDTPFGCHNTWQNINLCNEKR